MSKQGRGKRGRHTSLEKNIRPSFRWLESLPAVKKAILGVHDYCRHSHPPGYLQWKEDTSTGFKLKAYTGNGIQDVFVTIEPLTEREAVKAVISSKFSHEK